MSDIASSPNHQTMVWLSFITILGRYLLFAGVFYFIFYVWKKARYLHLKIQNRFPEAGQIQREIGYSISTVLVFTCMAIGVFYGQRAGIFKLIPFAQAQQLGFITSSFLLLVFWHDTWFYWTHRLMHHKAIFKYVHAIHHKSHNPSPWAAFAFHPLEAIIEAAFLPVLLLLIPIHSLGIFAFMLYMLFFNVLGHLGYEILPAWLFKSKIGQWQNSSTHHNMHHQYGKGNYSLYFNFWDRLMNTNHSKYQASLAAMLEKANSHPAPKLAKASKPRTLTLEKGQN